MGRKVPLIEASAPVVTSTVKAKLEKEWLSRKEAAIYLTRIGYRITAKTLANMAANNNKGKGPRYDRIGWSAAARYKREHLDAWAQARTEHVE
jgi:hypothetical protein